jgi:hypothetical protein
LASNEISSDLKSALKWGFDEKVIDRAYSSISGIVLNYESILKNELNNKVRKL